MKASTSRQGRSAYRRRAVVARVTVLLLLLLRVPAPAAHAQTRPATSSGEIVYYFPDTVGKDLSKIASNFQAWANEGLVPALGYPVQVRYFRRMQDLVAHMTDTLARKQLPVFAAMHAEVALENRHLWNLEMKAFAITEEDIPFHRISIAVRRDSPIQSLADLAGKTVIGCEYWTENLRRFERTVLGGALQVKQLANLEPSPSSISAIMGAYYKSADAALVSSRVFNVLRQRSAGVWRSMRIVHESKPLPVAFAVFFAGQDPRERAITVKSALAAHTIPAGKIYFDYVKLKRMEAGTWTDVFTAQDLAESAQETATTRSE
ncbi:MAG: PhnD/SsuA/transferrin family substrate-binding protein [Candidatus Schekmanbacteria bacterium]|nr:PhnD/SsuA/transferrin family substrate-binding protein [Candidatus Schekmanbacteria bacterium]